MIKIILLSFTVFFAICLNCPNAFGQFSAPTTAKWQSFEPEKEEFSIDFPLPPSTANYERNLLFRRYYSSINGTYFFISSDKISDPVQFKTVMTFVNAFQKTGSTEKIGKIKAEKFVFTDSEDFHHTVLTAKTKNRVYVFQTISALKDDPLADRFLDSLKLKERNDLEILETMPAPFGEEGSGTSNKDYGLNPQNSFTPPPPLPNDSDSKKVSAGVSVQSKPRASYTDLARFYEISGAMILKVTFLASGEIGTVSPVTKLPFGMTQMAIEAARNIKFDPAMKNGVPYSVTKAVQYSFTIY